MSADDSAKTASRRANSRQTTGDSSLKGSPALPRRVEPPVAVSSPKVRLERRPPYAGAMDLADRYVDLVKHAVNGDLSLEETVLVPVEPRGFVNTTVRRVLATQGIVATRPHTVERSSYAEGTHGWLTTRSGRGLS